MSWVFPYQMKENFNREITTEIFQAMLNRAMDDTAGRLKTRTQEQLKDLSYTIVPNRYRALIQRQRPWMY